MICFTIPESFFYKGRDDLFTSGRSYIPEDIFWRSMSSIVSSWLIYYAENSHSRKNPYVIKYEILIVTERQKDSRVLKLRLPQRKVDNAIGRGRGEEYHNIFKKIDMKFARFYSGR